jgi:predicted aldo/keto reductase-like oxidoreductase
MYKEIFDGLPGGKQNSFLKKAEKMRRDRGVDDPEYFIAFFGPNQRVQMHESYISNAMMEEYGEKVEGSPEFEKLIIETFEESLKRLKTDHVDILMCTHGCSSAEELENPYMISTFEKLKKQGKVSHLGVSTHNDVAGVLQGAMNSPHYDVIMLAYNIINHGYLDPLLREAHKRGMGVIAMKAANPVYSPHPATRPTPSWRLEKLNHFVPGDMNAAVKGYIWVLQNPHIAAAVSEMFTEEVVRENLTIPGMRIEQLPA